jgi:hypothetical protein
MTRSDDLSHWHHSVENFNTSALEFFKAIEETLAEKKAPVRSERVEHAEGGVLSAKREYLRLSHGRYSFDICAAAFGSDFFFSWWLGRRRAENARLFGCVGLLAMPVLFLITLKMGGLFVGPILFLGAIGAAAFFLLQGPTADLVEDAILAAPIVGLLYERFVRPTTFFSEDTRKMFEETIHRVVIAHVSGLLAAAKLPTLGPDAIALQRGKAQA